MPVSEATRALMQQTNQRFCDEVLRERRFAALDLVYTAEARVLPPGAEMVEGREAIRAFWEGAVTGLGIQSGTLASVQVEEAGDTMVEIGRAELTLEGGALVPVKYVVHWRQEDGVWKWHVDIWNANQ